MKITRYCPVCKHTTKHDYNPNTGRAVCLRKTHPDIRKTKKG